MSNVNSPLHYQQGGIETIDYIKAKLGSIGFASYCLGNVMKYTSRWRHKAGLEDLKKAEVYLQWAIKELDIGPEQLELFSEDSVEHRRVPRFQEDIREKEGQQ